MNQSPYLSLRGVRKVFPGVVALDDVDLDIELGQVHSLCGENGAGKSTLMKIIAGAQAFTAGTMLINGQEVKFKSTNDAEAAGIAMIYQEFNMCPNLTAAENIMLGDWPTNSLGKINHKKMQAEAQKWIDDLGVHCSANSKISDLGVAEVQMCEIIKALRKGSKVLIMDEPTAALTQEESELLFEKIEQMKASGMAIIYVSHRMDEVFRISDKITVFRNGRHIKTLNVQETNYREIVSLMVGRTVDELYPKRTYERRSEILRLENIVAPNVDHVSLVLHEGEILGLAGLLGAGNIDLGRAIFGVVKRKSGTIRIRNKVVQIESPIDALAAGIGFVSEDRKQEGLVLCQGVRENITMASLKELSPRGHIRSVLENEKFRRQVKALNIKVSGPSQKCMNLSGGNQQKVVLAKMLETKAFIYFLNEPTRGVDVGAKQEIYDIINSLSQNGSSILLASSDLPELAGMCDRVLVFRDGRIVCELRKDEISQHQILAFASGGEEGK